MLSIFQLDLCITRDLDLYISILAISGCANSVKKSSVKKLNSSKELVMQVQLSDDVLTDTESFVAALSLQLHNIIIKTNKLYFFISLIFLKFFIFITSYRTCTTVVPSK